MTSNPQVPPAMPIPPSARDRSPRWVSDIIAGLVAGLLVLVVQVNIDDQRSEREDRRENLRFVRERSMGAEVARPFRSMNLTGQNLSGLELPRADFTGATLVGANLSEAILTDAKLGGADLTGANLAKVRLDGAPSLIGTKFINADLTGATLGAETSGSGNYSGAKLREASLNHASFSGKPNGLAVADRDMTGINLSEARLEGVDLRGKRLAGANFREAKLGGADLTGADLRSTVNLFGDPVGTDMEGADLSGAVLETICYDRNTRWPTDFVPPPSNCPADQRFASPKVDTDQP